jgi:ABC-type multidrug transport system fused ATPase/permease subunit
MATLRKVLATIGRYRPLLAASVLLAGLTVVLQLYVPILFGDAIDQVVAAGQVDFGSMGRVLALALGLVAASSVASWAMGVINNRLAFHTVRDIRAQAIRQIQALPLSYLDAHSAGDVVQRVIADVDQLSDGLLLGFTLAARFKARGQLGDLLLKTRHVNHADADGHAACQHHNGKKDPEPAGKKGIGLLHNAHPSLLIFSGLVFVHPL